SARWASSSGRARRSAGSSGRMAPGAPIRALLRQGRLESAEPGPGVSCPAGWGRYRRFPTPTAAASLPERSDGIALTYRAGLEHPYVHAPSTQLPAKLTVSPLQRISAEPASELRAPGVRGLGHFSHRLADLQLRARRQVVDREVEVDDQLVSGKLPAVAGTRNGGQHPAVHDRDLSERVRPFTGGSSPPRLPVVPTESVHRVEDPMQQDSSLLDSWPADDHLDNALICRRGAQAGRYLLELSKPSMVGHMLGELFGQALLDHAHVLLSGRLESSEHCSLGPGSASG